MTRASDPKPTGRVLVVDDHRAARESMADVLRCAGHTVSVAASAVEALELLDRERPDVVLTDLQMPGMDGLELIARVTRRRPAPQVLMITAHATISSAVEAIRRGAFEYLEKPFNAERLEELVARAIERRRLTGSDAIETLGLVDGMIGESAPMRTLREQIARVAPTDETVLVCGESGTGKELVASAIHAASRRAGGEFVSLNCPVLSPQLAESELFGHLRGAFTGADYDRVGRFEMAAGGTLLLDEVTEIDLALQAKLLRVLQERSFERVGSSETRPTDARVIASTNRDLADEVAAGRFRHDLYFRLAVVPLSVPPLRERGDDVQLLVDHFLRRAEQRLDRTGLEVSDDARVLLSAYHWPGNVRELENLVTRACVLNQGDAITADELRPWLQPTENAPLTNDAAPLPVGTKLQEMERRLIVATLEHFDGHRAKTAEALGIGVRTLSGKLRGYGYAPREKSFGQGDRQELPVGPAELAGASRRAAA